MINEILQKSEVDLIKYTKQKLKENGYEYVFASKDYVLALGTIPVLLVAHLDTVHKELPETILFDKEQNLLWSPEGIGGDDRCGVYAILEITKEFMPYVLFTTEEEVGGLGAEEFTSVIDIDARQFVNYIIEIDRRGNNQAVFYDCGNKDFKQFILSFGFQEQWGTFSDISVLSPAYNIASVNLSAGYYNEHTKTEYIDLDALQNTIDKVKKILKGKNDQYYDYQEIRKFYTPYTRIGKDNNYNYDYECDVYEDDMNDIDTQREVQNQMLAEEDEMMDKNYLEKLIIEDYNELSDEEFEEIYNKKKPKNIDELLRKINDFKFTK